MKISWIQLAAIIATVVVLVILVIICFFRCRRLKRKRREFIDSARISTSENLQTGIAKLHASHHDQDNKKKVNYYVLRRELSVKPCFSWSDHPSLVSEAVEHGWSRFGFNGYMSSSATSTRSVLLGLCASGDEGRGREVDVNWELCPDSADFMQKIRLNSGKKKPNFGGNGLYANCVIKASLPLPGPPLGNSTFPQEAYFEITILSCGEDGIESVRREKDGKIESDRIKLIQEGIEGNGIQSDSLVHVSSARSSTNRIDELKLRSREEEEKDGVMLSLGLTQGGSLPWKLPGSYPGSIGFNSTGSVYLDGLKLVFEAEKGQWGSADRVIGCGYDPTQKKVFFTVDSQLVHLVNCKSNDFSSPLYPTLAANADVTVLVNFGQSAFMYAPANAQRTPNPCFIGQLANAPAAALGYEDSRELFSMGRIDSEWFNRSTTKSSHATSNFDNVAVDIDEESETDLFEIVLDRMSKSPSTVS